MRVSFQVFPEWFQLIQPILFLEGHLHAVFKTTKKNKTDKKKQDQTDNFITYISTWSPK